MRKKIFFAPKKCYFRKKNKHIEVQNEQNDDIRLYDLNLRVESVADQLSIRTVITYTFTK